MHLFLNYELLKFGLCVDARKDRKIKLIGTFLLVKTSKYFMKGDKGRSARYGNGQ